MTHASSPVSHAGGPPDADKPILFVFGSARGGTTFLSALLSQWFSFGMGPEGTFISDIVELANSLKDSSVEHRKRQLAEGVVATQTLQIIQHRWDSEHSFSVSPDEVMALMPAADASSAIYAAFEIMAIKMGQTRVGNKNPGYWREIDTLNDLFPDNARYLFIVRDGRDVALSLKEVPWGGHSAYAAASIWRNMVDTADRFAKQLPKGRLLRIRYEDLLEDPAETFRHIGEFVGQDNLDTLCQEYVKAAADNSLQSNFGKWRQAMPESEQRVYEAVAGNQLEQLGYERLYPTEQIGALRDTAYRAQEFLRKVRANLYHLRGRLPLDARASEKSSLTRLLQPGRRRKHP